MYRSERIQNLKNTITESPKKVSVVLPTYNEKENIGPLIDEIIRTVKNRELEIIVVDDDSPDGTWMIVDEKAKTDGRILLTRRIGIKGLTSALNDGIRKASGDIVVWMDCDFQMPPSKISELLSAIDSGYDVAVGSRFVKGGGDARNDRSLNQPRIVYIHRFLSRLICAFCSFIFRMDFKDWTSGFIAIRKHIFDDIMLFGDYGEYFIYLIHYAVSSGYKVVEIPYVVTPRLRGSSKTSASYLGMISKGVKYVAALVNLAFFKSYKKLRRQN
jgi:dolichol-phosphate mannosyltransferase